MTHLTVATMLIMRQRQNTRDTTGHTHKNADIGEGDYDYHNYSGTFS